MTFQTRAIDNGELADVGVAVDRAPFGGTDADAAITKMADGAEGGTTMQRVRTSPPDSHDGGAVVRQAPIDITVCSFAQSGPGLLSDDMVARRTGDGVTVAQANGNLVVGLGVAPNDEFLARSVASFHGALMVRAQTSLSQRIAQNTFAVLLADRVGEGLACTIDSPTSITVTLPAHGMTDQNIGQSMFVGGIAGAAGVPGRYPIAAVPSANELTFTVAGWPASGSCTLDLFGWNHYKILYTGTSATAALFDAQRRGWASGDTSIATNTTAGVGHIASIVNDGRNAYVADMLAASSTAPAISTRGSRYSNIPDDDVDLHVYLWAYNGTAAPASSTTWTLGFWAVEDTTNNVVYLGGVRPMGQGPALPVVFPAAQSVNATLIASTVRAAFVAASGIWFDDTSTALGANGTFTGASRDLTVTATAAAWANAATYAHELRASAESDQAGTLWLEVSRDNTNWRRVKAVPTAAVAGGGQYAEIVHRPSWRYARVGFTNGATAQARLALGSVLTAA